MKIQQEKIHMLQVRSQLVESQKENVLIEELKLEKVQEEAAAAKEELKLQQKLAVKEASLMHLQKGLCKVKENLVQAEERLVSYMRKDKEQSKPESKKAAEVSCDWSTGESTLIGKSSSSQTDKTVEINSRIHTSPVLVKNAEIQMDFSSEEIAEIVREFTEETDQMQELHAAETVDTETRRISEREALKRGLWRCECGLENVTL